MHARFPTPNLLQKMFVCTHTKKAVVTSHKSFFPFELLEINKRHGIIFQLKPPRRTRTAALVCKLTAPILRGGFSWRYCSIFVYWL